MALRPASAKGIGRRESPLTALAAVEAVVVTALDSSGAISLRAIRDALALIPEVSAARSWASTSAADTAAVSRAVASLSAASYAASMDALEAPPF